MANNTDFRKFMAPDFQASPAPALEWMPWQDTSQQDADALGGALGQLRPKPTGMTKGGAMPSTEGKSDMLGGMGGKSL